MKDVSWLQNFHDFNYLQRKGLLGDKSYFLSKFLHNCIYYVFLLKKYMSPILRNLYKFCC